MPATGVYALPYPDADTSPNGPAQIQALAEGVEDELVRVDGVATGHDNEINALQAQVDFPSFALRRTTAQSISAGAFTAVQFTTEDNDSHGGHDNAVNPDRYTVQKAGLYLLAGGGSFVGNATGIRLARLTLNGAAISGSGNSSPNLGVSENAHVITRTVLVQAAVNDVFRMELLQNSGIALNTVTTDYFQPSMHGHWVKP